VLEGDPSKIDSRADELGKQIVQDQLNPSQVRNFYGAVAKLRAEVDGKKRLRQLRMHRSRLAYLTARAKGSADALWAVFGPLLQEAGETQVDAVCATMRELGLDVAEQQPEGDWVLLVGRIKE